MRPQDYEKTQASVAAVLAILMGAEEKSAHLSQVMLEASRWLRDQLGPGWTYLSAIQWLTGKRAWAVVQSLSSSERIGGLTGEQVQVLVVFASEFSEEFDLSAGAAIALGRIRAAGKVQV